MAIDQETATRKQVLTRVLLLFHFFPTALRSVSDGGGGSDFRFLATTNKITLKVTLANLKPDIFTGCHGAQHARVSSGHPRSNLETAGQEDLLLLKVRSGPRHRSHDYYFGVMTVYHPTS